LRCSSRSTTISVRRATRERVPPVAAEKREPVGPHGFVLGHHQHLDEEALEDLCELGDPPEAVS
jgi:hypothetical protein